MICISLPAPSSTSNLHTKHTIFSNIRRGKHKVTQDYIHIQWTKYQQDSISLCSTTFSDDQSYCEKKSPNNFSRSSSRSSRTSLETRDLVEEMFSNIEVWIAAHRDGMLDKILEAGEDLWFNE